MENHVNKIILICSFLCLFNCKSQQIDEKIYIDDSYYFIINRIISRDSTSIKKRIQRTSDNNKLTDEEKNRIIKSISNEKSYVNLKQFNSWLKWRIEKEFKNLTKNSPLIDYFGEKKLKTALAKLHKEELLNKNKIDSHIKIANEDNYPKHYFSSPLVIENKMIVFHMAYSGELDQVSEIYIYKITRNKKPKLIKIVHRSIS